MKAMQGEKGEEEKKNKVRVKCVSVVSKLGNQCV